MRHAMKPTMLLKISVLVLAASVEAVGATSDGVRRLASEEPSPKNCAALENFKEVCETKKERKKLKKVCEKSEKKFCEKDQERKKLSEGCRDACCPSEPSEKNCDALENFKDVCTKSDRKTWKKVCEKPGKKMCKKEQKKKKLSESCRDACCPLPPSSSPSPPPSSSPTPPPSSSPTPPPATATTTLARFDGGAAQRQ